MNQKSLLQLIQQGENEKIEFKSAFNDEVIETLVAFANTSGGKVLIGVADNSDIKGIIINKETIQNRVNEVKSKTSPVLVPDVEVVKSGSKNIAVLSIQEYPVKPVSFRGRYYKRVANSNHALSVAEVVNMHLQTFNYSWDYHTNNRFSVEDISMEKVQTAIDNLNLTGIRITEDPMTFLIKNDLIREGLLTNAAYLLFTKKETVITTIELGRFQSETLIKDSARTKSDILAQVEQVLDFVKKHINKEVIITGKARNTERWQYPLEALREIIMNMLVHRDYRSASDSIVKIFNHKIEFYNPGRLPDNIRIEDLLSNNYKSTPRNKLIADFFKALGLIEKYGSGIRRIMEEFSKENLPVPVFQNISDGFMVTVSDGENENVVENVVENVTENVTEKRRHSIIRIINDNNLITTDEIAKILDVTRRTVARDVEALKAAGKLKRIGPDKGGYWKVIA